MAMAYITCRDREEAKKISAALLEKRIIACANIFPIESMYWWEGKIKEDAEFVLLAKSKGKNFEKIVQEVRKLHSYEVPAIMDISCECSEEYGDWVDKVLS